MIVKLTRYTTDLKPCVQKWQHSNFKLLDLVKYQQFALDSEKNFIGYKPKFKPRLFIVQLKENLSINLNVKLDK